MLTRYQQNLAENLAKYKVIVVTAAGQVATYEMQEVHIGQFRTIVFWTSDNRSVPTVTDFNRKSNTINIAWLIAEILHHYPQQVQRVTVMKSDKVRKVYTY